jgi:hypothetical protein
MDFEEHFVRRDQHRIYALQQMLKGHTETEWFGLDGTEGNAADATKHLTPAQIRGVERLIDEWKQQHRPSRELSAALHIMEASSR